MAHARVKKPSAWTYHTSAGAGAGMGFAATEEGSIYLKSPQGQVVTYHYSADGLGASVGLKIPGGGKLEIRGKGLTGTLATEANLSGGVIYILETFKGDELSSRDFLGNCFFIELAAGFGFGANAVAMIMGMPPRDVTRGLLEEFIIDTSLPPAAVNELNKHGVTDTLGIQNAKAILLMAGMNSGAQAFYGGNIMLGKISLGGPPPDERKGVQKPIRVPRILVREVGPHLYELPGDALFDFNEFKIRDDAKAELTKLGPVISARTGYGISIEGHTDSKGDGAYNMKLSRQRAQAVAQWLIENKLAKAGDLKTVGFGKSRPKVSNVKPNGQDDPDGRALNRRVEIRFTKGG
jgi:outer membrane protein OmpA-like peptidoglycan-associated protein